MHFLHFYCPCLASAVIAYFSLLMSINSHYVLSQLSINFVLVQISSCTQLLESFSTDLWNPYHLYKFCLIHIWCILIIHYLFIYKISDQSLPCPQQLAYSFLLLECNCSHFRLFAFFRFDDTCNLFIYIFFCIL